MENFNAPATATPPSHPQNAREHIVMAFGTHWVKYCLPTIIYLILTVAAASILAALVMNFQAGNTAAATGFVWTVVGFTVVHHWYFEKLLSDSTDEIIITNKRIIYINDHLFFSDDMMEFTIQKIVGIQAKKNGILQNILRYGSLHLDTGGTDMARESAQIPLVPHPNAVVREITRLRQQ